MSKSPPVTVEWSHGRPRVTSRRPSDGGPPSLPASELSGPVRDPETGRWAKGNRAWRRRVVKAHAAQLAALDPRTCAAWLRPHVEDGAEYACELAMRFSDPALARLVLDTAAARVAYNALLGLAGQGDGEALKEARAWLREHRACLTTLTALAASTVPNGGASGELAKLRARVTDGGGA